MFKARLLALLFVCSGTASASVIINPGGGGTGNAVLAGTQTWTGGNTFKSSTTFTGVVQISTSVQLSGSTGSNGQVLTSGGPGAIPTWATAGGGAVVQCVSTTTYKVTTVAGTAFAPTDAVLTITPTSSSNKILLWVSGTIFSNAPGNSNGNLTVCRGGPVCFGDPQYGLFTASISATGVSFWYMPVGGVYKDSPATTSVTSYTIEISNDQSKTTKFPSGAGEPGTLVACEVTP